MRILIVGFGVVGQATVGLLAEQRSRLAQQHGLNPRIVGVVNSTGAITSTKELDVAALLGGELPWTRGRSALEVISQVEADVVIEAGPTSLADPGAGIERLQAAFRTGKHAISVNKAPLAVAMPPLLELARYNGVQFRFSGTVGGGTPFLDWAARCADGDEVLGMRGILNGTTNYILTQMRREMPFDVALAEAQRKGYAEADPTMDIDGIDSAIKLVILANTVLGRRAVLSDVSVTGIRGLRLGTDNVRLLAEVGETLSVAPRHIDRGSPLDVSGTLNALSVLLRNGGEVTLVGRGAGGPETATSVVRDLISIWHSHWTNR
ncbi:MAG: homoserine dehydrogenase [Candidatus Schekmanbacteria bacterium]|nr:homoserine dehydrogenase [Candidatus Schekmanbacteria bacterium]